MWRVHRIKPDRPLYESLSVDGFSGQRQRQTQRDVPFGIVGIGADRQIGGCECESVLAVIQMDPGSGNMGERARVLFGQDHVVVSSPVKLTPGNADILFPPQSVTSIVDQCERGIGPTVLWVEFYGFLKVGNRFGVLSPGILHIQLPTSLKRCTRFNGVGLPGSYLDLLLCRELQRKRIDNLANERVLNGEDLRSSAIVTIRPDLPARRCVDQLRIDPNLIARSSHAAFTRYRTPSSSATMRISTVRSL